MRIRKLATIVIIFGAIFAAYNFGKYLDMLVGLALTSVLGFVAYVVIEGLAARDRTRQP